MTKISDEIIRNVNCGAARDKQFGTPQKVTDSTNILISNVMAVLSRSSILLHLAGKKNPLSNNNVTNFRAKIVGTKASDAKEEMILLVGFSLVLESTKHV